MKLYELTSEIARIESAAYGSEEDFEFLDLLKALKIEAEADRVQKFENIARLIRQMELDCESLEDEQKRLAGREDTLRNRIESLKFYVGNNLGEGKTLKTPTFSFGWRRSSSVEITGDVPEAYQRTKVIVEPDKKQITADLKAGATLGFAHLVEKQNLQIK